MKTRRGVYIFVGSLLIIINLLVDLVSFGDYQTENDSSAYNFGYLLGAHIFLIVGLVFLRSAYKVHKKIKNKDGNHLEDAINSIGDNQV